MRIFIFKSDTNPDLRAFSDDQEGNKLPVCTKNLNANVVMVKSAQDRVRIDRSDPLNRAIDRRIFIQ
jgi:hypothetical protein